MSGRCRGLHCDGCRHGGAGAAAGIGALVLLVGVLELAAHRRTVAHAASDAVRVAVLALAVAAVTLAAAALAAGGVWAARQRARRLAARQRAAVAPLLPWVIPAPRPDEDRPAVEAGRPRVLRVLPGGQRDTYNPRARREQRR